MSPSLEYEKEKVKDREENYNAREKEENAGKDKKEDNDLNNNENLIHRDNEVNEVKKITSKIDLDQYDEFSRKMFMWGAFVGTVMGIANYYLEVYRIMAYNYGTALMILLLVFIHIYLINKNREDELKMKAIRYSFTLNAFFWLLAALIFMINLFK